MLHQQLVIQQAPFFGAPTTVEKLRRAVADSQSHYALRQLVEDICDGLASKDYLSEALAIYHFVLARTRYMRDPRHIELVKAPYIVAEQILAGKRPSVDCDDVACFLCGLLQLAGHTVRVVTVAFKDSFYKGERQYSHIFCQVQEPRTGKWITLDPVAHQGTRGMHGRIVAAKIWPL